MHPRRGPVLAAACAAALITGVTAAPAQTPDATEPLAITLTASPKVQEADFDNVVKLTGTVTGGPNLATALAEKSLQLEVDAIAQGYNRPYDVEAVTPRADGTFTAKLDVAVNSTITLRAPEDSAFSGASPAVAVKWRPLPEVSNYSRGNKLVMEYRVSVPGGIPFTSGSFKIKRGSAKRAIFYAGPQNKPIPIVAKAKLESDYDGEVHATAAVRFKDLPPAPRGGRIYACVKGTPFLGFMPVDPACGEKRSDGVIKPPEL